MKYIYWAGALLVVIGLFFGINFYIKQSYSALPNIDLTTTDVSVVERQNNNSTPASSSVSVKTTVSKTGSTNSSVEVLPSGSSWMSSVPLGDGKYVTDAPKKGYIYICHVGSGGGAQGSPSWIHGSNWTPSEKVSVQGSVSWSQASYKMSVSGNTRTIVFNDLPTNHTTGIFPIQSSDPAYQYDRNPNSISAQSLSFSFPVSPTKLSSPQCIYGEVGIMNDGVMLFDGFDAENRDAVAHEVQDAYAGHPEKTGEYHHHGFESELKSEKVSEVVGFALDGFPITGPLLASGKYLTTGDLDECHGIKSTIILDGKSIYIYHYVLTQDFPYSVSCFKAVSNFKPGGSGQQSTELNQTPPSQTGQGGSSNPPAPPQEAIDACQGKSQGASCTVGVSVSGMCTNIGAYFACKP